MTEIKKNQIITELAEALQYNDYDKFASYFEENAVIELPFGSDGGTSIKGLPEIKKHLEGIASDPVLKLIHIEEVMTKSYHSDPFTTVEFFTKGRSVKAGGAFHIQSAIALIRFGESGIVYYKDIPNTTGLAKKAGASDSEKEQE
jgi:hypothetical protein